jgi:hypothetical protein
MARHAIYTVPVNLMHMDVSPPAPRLDDNDVALCRIPAKDGRVSYSGIISC